MGAKYDYLLGKLRTKDASGSLATFRLTDINGLQWDVTVDIDGSLTTTPYPPVVTTTGSPIGLLLTLTYP
jgi:hypothetical protein